MKVYLLHCNDRLSATVFYKTKRLAQQALKQKRDEIIRRMVTVTEDTEDKFSFYFGWEEHGVTWRVSEIEVLES